MRLSKDELISKYSDRFEDNSEEKISFLEDVADSIIQADNSEELKAKDAEIVRLRADNDALKERYIQRFMGDVGEETKRIDNDVINTAEEKTIIDIREI